MYPKKTFPKGLAYNFLSCLFKSDLALKQVIEFENITLWTTQRFPHVSTWAEKGYWRMVENRGNECLERIETIKVAEASRIKNKSVVDFNFTILLRIRSGAILWLPSLSLIIVSFSCSITRKSNWHVLLLHREVVLSGRAQSTSLLNKQRWLHTSPHSNWINFLT